MLNIENYLVIICSFRRKFTLEVNIWIYKIRKVGKRFSHIVTPAEGVNIYN